MPTPRRTMFARLRASFLTGLVVIAPVGLTIWLIWTVIGWIDGIVLPMVPVAYHPDRLIQTYFGLDPSAQINVRGIGVVIFLFFTIVVGWLAKGIIGRSFIRFAESLVKPHTGGPHNLFRDQTDFGNYFRTDRAEL